MVKTTAATGMMTWDSCCRVPETMPITKEPFLPTLPLKSPSLAGQHNTTALVMMKMAWVLLEVTEAALERNRMVSGGLAWWREWGSSAIGWVADREVLALGLW